MFGHQLFPTPEKVVLKMLEGLDVRGGAILDPSAGSGAILEVVSKKSVDYKWSYRANSELYAIEIDQDLREVLRGKGFKVIDSDFLQYAGYRYFKYILMNPPFDDGASHLLKAWEISQGATIRCLLNRDTLLNPYTQERKQLSAIIKEYGEWEDLGQCFMDAERPANVYVALVTLRDTRKQEAFRIDFEPETANGQAMFDDLPVGELVTADVFGSYEARFNAAIIAFKRALAATREVDYYLNGLLGEHKSGMDIVQDAFKTSGGYEAKYDTFVNQATEQAWNSLFSRTKLSSLITESVRHDLEKLQADQGRMAFNANNMNDLFYSLALSKNQIMLRCVLDVFDMLTKHYPENRILVEGWKTNSSYRVGKFILPDLRETYGERLDWAARDKLDDIDRAICFVAGKKFDEIKTIVSMYRDDSHYGQWRTSEFFRTKFHKKGTMHFEWLSKDTCEDFNAIVARERWGQVPEKTKAGVYR